MVAASHFPQSARSIQREFSSRYFHIFTSEDVVGVCLAGALKNVYAIGTGIADSLGYGDSARAATISRALAEMSQLGIRMGANPMTFLGLAGIGDLVLTCIGDQSRNRRTGLALGQGKKLEEVLQELGGVAEGVTTAKAVEALMQTKHISMPIAHLIYRILYEDLEVKKAIRILMSLPSFGEFR
jgi:glycerol-3-phosphate dehydrogenase (NAD(P)+)